MFVCVTYDQVEAMTMATRIAVMRDGALQQVGTPSDLYDHPANVFVAGFIGSPAMNFLRLRIERQGEALWLTNERTLTPGTSPAGERGESNGTIRLPVPPHALSRLTDIERAEVIAGVRTIAYPRAFEFKSRF